MLPYATRERDTPGRFQDDARLRAFTLINRANRFLPFMKMTVRFKISLGNLLISNPLCS